MNFSGYRVDTVHRVITTARGRVVRIEPKAFDLLLYFTQHPEETISRERLLAEVWDGKFVTDDAVMVAVYALRQAFEDDSRAPKFIETIRGRGYRWIAAPALPLAPARALSNRRGLLATALAVIATGFAGALVWGLVHPPQPMPSIKRASEVVRANARGAFFSERTPSPLDWERGRIGRHDLAGALCIAAQGGREDPGVGELRVELDRAIGVMNAHDRDTPARTNVAVRAKRLEERRQAREVVCIPEDDTITSVGGNPEETLAGELHAVRIVTNNGVLQHLASESELAVRGQSRKGDEEKKKKDQCVSHARNVTPRSPEVLRVS